jgi:hypothetical protein
MTRRKVDAMKRETDTDDDDDGDNDGGGDVIPRMSINEQLFQIREQQQQLRISFCTYIYVIYTINN